MSFNQIGILSIGEMGYHWARTLGAHGAKVLTFAGDRSEATQRRAESVGVELVPSLEDLVSRADLIVSIVVPFAAKPVAQGVARALTKRGRSDLLYVDANATSPMTAEEIGRILSRAQARFVDGCILGGAARIDQGTMVYVSGEHASSVVPLNELGLCVKVLGTGLTQASAFKVIHAGLTKGLAGLFTELLVGAEKLGLLDETLEDYERSYPGIASKVGQTMLSLPLHAGRRSEEMVELRETYLHYGLNPIVVPAVEKVLKGIAALKPGEGAGASARAESLVEVIKSFTERGLLRNGRSPKKPSHRKTTRTKKRGTTRRRKVG
ncbi:MAG: NAD(P)-binding domain-containing protein [Candidatus Binatia bacterium]